MNVASNKIRFDTQSEMKECHIFIAITNKVRSNKMIAIRRRTLIIKVLFFIVSLLSFSRLEDDTHIKCSYQNYLISVALKQANKQIFLPFVTFFRKDVIIVVGINLNTNFQMWFTHAPYLIDTRTFMIRVLICTNLW